MKKLSCHHKSKPIATGFLMLMLISLLLGSGSFKRISASPYKGNSLLQNKAKIQDKGDFKVVYARVKNQDYAQFQKELQQEKVLESIATDLNETFALPTNVYLTFGECGEANAFYDPEAHKLTMCYELLENFYEIFAKHEKSPDTVDDAVIGATISVFYHELGHALIHIYDLPITGKEEDAVDQLSVYLLTDGTDEGEKMAIDGARSFYLMAQEEEKNVKDLAYWDEHSLGKQRFYNIICLVYGQNEQKFAYLVKKKVLPADRAERCSDEYQQVEKAWTRLLAPYIKN